jgi:hypothetical protein
LPHRSTAGIRSSAGRRASFGANLLLGCASILVALGALELGIRFIESRPLKPAPAGNAGPDSAAAGAAFAGDPTPIYVPSATLGWILRPDTLQHFRRRDFDTVVRSNALGFRGPPIAERAPGVTRWAVLGDSYGFGWGVEEEETYAARLAAILNRAPAKAGAAIGDTESRYTESRYEVVNGALPGFGTFQRLRALEALLPYGLDGVVIEFSVSNDVVDDWRAAPYVPDHLGDYQTQGTRFTALERVATRRSHLARVVWERAMPLRLWMEARRGPNLQRSNALYDTLVARAQGAGLAVVVLVNPARTQVLGDEGGVMGWLASSSYGRRPNLMIGEVIARHALPAVDGEAVFRTARPRELFLGRDVHWTPAGHERVAEALAAVLPRAAAAAASAVSELTKGPVSSSGHACPPDGGSASVGALGRPVTGAHDASSLRGPTRSATVVGRRC